MDIGKLFKDAWGLYVKDVGPLIVGVFIASLVPALAGAVIAIATIGAGIGGLSASGRHDVNGFTTMDWTLMGLGLGLVVVVVVLLTAPLYVGVLSGLIRRVRQGREMGYGDAFSGFQVFGRAAWAYVLVYLLVPVALLVVPIGLVVVGAITTTWVVLALGVLLVIAAIVVLVYLNVAWAYLFPVVVDSDLGVSEAMRESRVLVHGSGWWWTFLALLVMGLVVSAASSALGLIPVVGALGSIVIAPFVLTYVAAMYFQARAEGNLVDAALRPGVPMAPGPGAPAAPGLSPYVSPLAPPAPPAPGVAPYVEAPAATKDAESEKAHSPAAEAHLPAPEVQPPAPERRPSAPEAPRAPDMPLPPAPPVGTSSAES
jgi:hypothetical protein